MVFVFANVIIHNGWTSVLEKNMVIGSFKVKLINVAVI